VEDCVDHPGEDGIADVPVEGGHRSRVDRPLKPGTDDKIRTGRERGYESGYIAEVIGVIRIAYDNEPPLRFSKRGEVGIAVPAFFRPYHPGSEGSCDLRCPVCGGIRENDLAADGIVAEHGLDLTDAFADRLLFIESREDYRDFDRVFRSMGRIHWLSLMDLFVRQ